MPLLFVKPLEKMQLFPAVTDSLTKPTGEITRIFSSKWKTTNRISGHVDDFKTECRPCRSAFLRKGWGGRVFLDTSGRFFVLGVDSPFFSTIVLFTNQPFSLGFRRFSRKKDPRYVANWGGRSNSPTGNCIERSIHRPSWTKAAGRMDSNAYERCDNRQPAGVRFGLVHTVDCVKCLVTSELQQSGLQLPKLRCKLSASLFPRPSNRVPKNQLPSHEAHALSSRTVNSLGLDHFSGKQPVPTLFGQSTQEVSK